jgi:hypothetical protein
MKTTAGTLLVLAAFSGCVPLQTNSRVAGRQQNLRPPTAPATAAGTSPTSPLPPLYQPGSTEAQAKARGGMLTGFAKGPGTAPASASLSKGFTGTDSVRPALLGPGAMAAARPNPPPVSATGTGTGMPLNPPGAIKSPPQPSGGLIPLPGTLTGSLPRTPAEVVSGEAVGPLANKEAKPDEGSGVAQVGHQQGAPAVPGVMPNPGLARAMPGAQADVQGKGAPMMRLVNTKQITLNFQVQDVGPSGVAAVELWYTQDCKEWHKYDAPRQAHAYLIEVEEEGMYGFTLLARNGLGLGDDPPKPGDLPQVWVVVDLTEPKLQIDKVEPKLGGKVNLVAIQWTARDENLGRQPIQLSYSASEAGPWLPIADQLPNTGNFDWAMPARVPPKLYLRVGATDLAGNHSTAQTPQPILLDIKKPRVSIIDIAPNRQE